MRADPLTEVAGGASTRHHAIEVPTQFFTGARDMGEPLGHLVRRVQTAKIEIAAPVAEPATHLHERVIHLGCTQEVADGKAFEREPATEFVSTDGDDVQPRLLVFDVVEYLASQAVDLPDLYRTDGLLEVRLQVAPVHGLGGLQAAPDDGAGGRDEVRLPEIAKGLAGQGRITFSMSQTSA